MNKKDSSAEDTLCGRPIERVPEEITISHGFPAPGVVIGAVMVDRAREQIGPVIEADAIVETLPRKLNFFWGIGASCRGGIVAGSHTYEAPIKRRGAPQPATRPQAGSGNRKTGHPP